MPYNESTLLFLGGWNLIWIALFGGIALLILFLTWLDLRELRGKRRTFLTILRGITLTSGVLLLLEPAIELKQVTHVKNHVPVLMDLSESQSLDSNGSTRLSRSQTALHQLSPLLTTPNEEHLFDFFTFDETLTQNTYAGLEDQTLSADGDASEILESITVAVEQFGRRDLGGIILLSDGIDTGTLSQRVHRGESLDGDTRDFLASLEVPIHTFATAEADQIRDIAISNVLHDDFAFVRNTVSVITEVRVLGVEPSTIPVSLYRGGELLQTQRLHVLADQEDYRVTFEFVPELIGKEVYHVQLPTLRDEALTSNNDAYFIINAIRDKIRALLVVGRPSWDERVLRQLLQGNPNIELISFFILRTNEDISRARNNELSLIPFPTQELFNEELGSFDLVIFQNFTYEPYGMRRYLDNIRDYVRDGGGFMMIGGEQSFASGGYARTEIAEILPLRLPRGGSRRTLVDETHFRPVLTDAGNRHPITRLAFDPGNNSAHWNDLPLMRGTNIVLGAQEGATVLATHPTLRGENGPMPVIAVNDVEDGRVMALTIDSTWRWSFDYVAEGGTARSYSSFYNSAIRWLIRDPELNLIQVSLAEEVYEPSETALAQIRVFRPDYSPASNAEGIVRVVQQTLDELGSGEEIVVLDETFQADEQGRVTIEIPLENVGAYTVTAQAEVEENTLAEDAEIFLALEQQPELSDIAPRPSLLEMISESTGGTHQVLPVRRINDLDFAPARTVQVNRRKVIDLWNTPWILLVFALFLGIDWTLRRRWGRL